MASGICVTASFRRAMTEEMPRTKAAVAWNASGLDCATRGFSFKSKQKIDMNMGLTNLSAEKILNNCDEHYLKLILKILGDEKEA